MSVIELSEPTVAQQQLAHHNQNIGGLLNGSAEFNVPANIAWCVVGTVVADAATPADVPTLKTAIEALAEVTSVNGNQLWGQIPSTILAVNHEAVLHVTSQMSANIGSGGDVFRERIKAHETVKPPLNKKWCVWILRVPAALDATKIAALETALEGITGISTAEHLIDGLTSARQSGNAALTVSAHLRIDPLQT